MTPDKNSQTETSRNEIGMIFSHGDIHMELKIL